MTERTHAVVTIPIQVDRLLTPNGRGHWAKKRKAQESAKEATKGACVNARLYDLTFTPPLTLHYLIAHGKGRKVLDDDNAIAAMKYIRDQIAEYLGMDDRQMTTGSMTQERDESGAGFVRVAIEEGCA